jgi:hypothetical protein
MTPLDIVQNISLGNHQQFDEIDSEYIPFIINRSFSMVKETLFFAQQMNLNPHLENRLQFDFYCGRIPSKKRYFRWHRKHMPDIDTLNCVIEKYGYSKKRALEALKLLSEDECQQIKQEFAIGGKKDFKEI